MLVFPFSCVLLFITATSVAFVFLCTCWTFRIITEPESLNTLQFTSVWQKLVLDMFFCFVLKSTFLSISTLAFNTSCLYRKIHGLPTTVKPLGEVNVCTGSDRQSILLITHLQASGVVAKKLSIGQACSDAYSAAFGGLGHRQFLRQKGHLHRYWLWLVERAWCMLSLAHLLSSCSFFSPLLLMPLLTCFPSHSSCLHAHNKVWKDPQTLNCSSDFKFLTNTTSRKRLFFHLSTLQSVVVPAIIL